jgi:CDP-paratose 2-epimerase
LARKYLILGGCGFLGSNIAARLLGDTRQAVTIFDNLSRLGSTRNLDWLRSLGAFQFAQADVSSAHDIESVVRELCPDVIFHLAGQVAMTTSISNPRLDFDTNVVGSFNVLEAVRKFAPEAAVIYSSTNKVYGDLEHLAYLESETRYSLRDFPEGISEEVGLDFHSPYGCSKGAADQYMLDYARIFGLNTAVFRHSSMYGSRQFATYDQGWIGWFCAQVLAQAQKPSAETFTISGSGKQVRDVLHADDMVDLYLIAATNISSIRGQAFNIGGGIANSLSVLELLQFLGNELGITARFERRPNRESDQKVFVADIGKARRDLGWHPKIDWQTGLRSMIGWVKSNV